MRAHTRVRASAYTHTHTHTHNMFVSRRGDSGVCAREAILGGATGVTEVDTQGCGLGEDVADLRLELGVKAARWKRNWSWLCCA
jgi:hypothetical protein